MTFISCQEILTEHLLDAVQFLAVENTAVNKTNEVYALGGLREGSEGRRGGRPVNGRYTAFREQRVQGRKGDG